MKIEATGNTEKQAEYTLSKRRNEVLDKYPDTKFSEIKKYGNFELGYKFVQEYNRSLI